jgi:hypothetical protein
MKTVPDPPLLRQGREYVDCLLLRKELYCGCVIIGMSKDKVTPDPKRSRYEWNGMSWLGLLFFFQ